MAGPSTERMIASHVRRREDRCRRAPTGAGRGRRPRRTVGTPFAAAFPHTVARRPMPATPVPGPRRPGRPRAAPDSDREREGRPAGAARGGRADPGVSATRGLEQEGRMPPSTRPHHTVSIVSLPNRGGASRSDGGQAVTATGTPGRRAKLVRSRVMPCAAPAPTSLGATG